MKFSDGNHNRSDVSVRGSFGLSIPKDLYGAIAGMLCLNSLNSFPTFYHIPKVSVYVLVNSEKTAIVCAKQLVQKLGESCWRCLKTYNKEFSLHAVDAGL